MFESLLNLATTIVAKKRALKMKPSSKKRKINPLSDKVCVIILLHWQYDTYAFRGNQHKKKLKSMIYFLNCIPMQMHPW